MNRNYIHVVNTYTPNSESERARLDRAKRTWPFHSTVYRESYERSSLDLGDNRNVAFVKDVMNSAEAGVGMGGGGVEDWVVLTNADSCLAEEIITVLDANQTGWSNRYDVDKPMRTTLKVQQIKDRGLPHRGLDLVAMPWSHWVSIRDGYPDMLLGYEAWDAVMMLFLGVNKNIGPIVYHEMHGFPYWYTHRLVSKGNLHNRSLAREWLTAKGLMKTAINMWPGLKHY